MASSSSPTFHNSLEDLSQRSVVARSERQRSKSLPSGSSNIGWPDTIKILQDHVQDLESKISDLEKALKRQKHKYELCKKDRDHALESLYDAQASLASLGDSPPADQRLLEFRVRIVDALIETRAQNQQLNVSHILSKNIKLFNIPSRSI